MTSRRPDPAEVLRLASEFGVSKEAMARSYIEAQHEAIAVIVLQHGRLARVYRHSDMPWIERSLGTEAPTTRSPVATYSSLVSCQTFRCAIPICGLTLASRRGWSSLRNSVLVKPTASPCSCCTRSWSETEQSNGRQIWR